MAITKIKSESLLLSDDFAFTGTVTGTPSITMADQWRITSNISTSTHTADTLVNSNWERNDTNGFSKVGTGMTESSGTFSFPETGIYLITINYFYKQTSGGIQYAGVSIQTTTDNSTYNKQTDDTISVQSSSIPRNCGFGQFIFDVTNTTTHKVRFYYFVQGDSLIMSNTDKSLTYATFTKLADT